MPRPTPNRTNARAHILDVAMALLRDGGPEGLTQTRVARAAGVSQGHLTYFFPRKTDLWVAVAERTIEKLSEQLGEFFSGKNWSADASTRDRVGELIAYLVKDRHRTRLMVTLALKSTSDPELRSIVVRDIDRMRDLIAAGLGEGADPRDVDIIMATLWGLGIQHLLLDGVRTDDYTAELIARFFRYGAKGESK